MAEIFPIPANMTNVVDLLPLASSTVGDVLGIMLLILIGGCTWMVTSSYSMKQTAMATGYMLTISSSFLWILELLAVQYVWVCIAGLIGAISVSVLKGGGATA